MSDELQTTDKMIEAGMAVIGPHIGDSLSVQDAVELIVEISTAMRKRERDPEITESNDEGLNLGDWTDLCLRIAKHQRSGRARHHPTLDEWRIIERTLLLLKEELNRAKL